MHESPPGNGDPILLTPGPLTTSESVKEAMLHDLGSRDKAFIELTARVRRQLVSVLSGGDTTDDLTAVPLQGSGTFAVEAMLVQFVPPGHGKLLVLGNGAYGRRMADICKAHGRPCDLVEWREDAPLDLDDVEKALDSYSDATHVAIVACETTTGVLNPVSEIAEAVKGRGMRLLIDAMSSFGVLGLDARMPFDAVAASSNKALQGSPGMAFVIARTSALSASAGNADTLVLDLFAQWQAFESNGQWRFTPPTHCILALAQALDEFEAEGGVSGRRKRYEMNCQTLVDGMRDLGFATLLEDDVQAPVIVTFRMPEDPLFNFQEFYERLSGKGYNIYPGKLASVPSFRVGCIGHVFQTDLLGYLQAVRETLKEMGIQLA